MHCCCDLDSESSCDSESSEEDNFQLSKTFLCEKKKLSLPQAKRDQCFSTEKRKQFAECPLSSAEHIFFSNKKEKELLSHATKKYRRKISLLEEKLRNAYIDLSKQISNHQDQRKQKISKVSNKIWSCRVLFQEVISFLSFTMLTCLQTVNHLWSQEIHHFTLSVYTKFYISLPFQDQFPSSSSMNWIRSLLSCQSLKRVSLSKQGFALSIEHHFWNHFVTTCSSEQEMTKYAQWVCLYPHIKCLTTIHTAQKTKLVDTANLTLQKCHVKLFTSLASWHIYPNKINIKNFFLENMFDQNRYLVANEIFHYRKELKLDIKDFFQYYLLSKDKTWISWLYEKGFNPFDPISSLSLHSSFIEMYEDVFRKDFRFLARKFSIDFSLQIRSTKYGDKIFYCWKDLLEPTLLHFCIVESELGK